MPAEIPIPWGDYWSIGSLVFDLVAQLTGIPTPMDLLFEQFSGRPTMEATIDEAKILAQHASPVLKMLAVGASELVQRGIPVSSPGAAPIFGPYFVAARMLEDGIRWGSTSRSVVNVDNETLTAALNEAGNPGLAGTSTLTAIDEAWSQWAATYPLGSLTIPTYFLTLRNSSASDPASLLARGWIDSWFGYPRPTNVPPPIPPSTSQSPGPPAPTPPPPPKPPQPPPLAPTQQGPSGPTGAELGGVFDLVHQFSGGPYPTAHGVIKIDGRQVWEGPAGNQEANQKVTLSYQWNTLEWTDGAHTITYQWVGAGGLVHGTYTEVLHTLNHQPPPKPPVKPPTPPAHQPPPLPPAISRGGRPPADVPWENFFKVCEDTPACENLSDDYLAMTQALTNIAYAVYHLPQLWSQQDEDSCCQQLIAELTQIVTQLTSMVTTMRDTPSLLTILPALDAINAALVNVAEALTGATPNFDGVIAELRRDNELLLNQMEKDRETLLADPTQVQQAVKDIQARREAALTILRDEFGWDSGVIQQLHA
jgi:hypothetical protein